MKVNKEKTFEQCHNCLAKDIEIFELKRKISQLQGDLIQANDKTISSYQCQPLKPQMKVIFRR